ncbi:hypothetical protein [Litchfieldia alkalitelluris]|uniref:hypothetical protein n=1 Tax=Litchfieldia alkalitelluris TaxID=304268 RepID=UPI0038B3D3BE
MNILVTGGAGYIGSLFLATVYGDNKVPFKETMDLLSTTIFYQPQILTVKQKP